MHTQRNPSARHFALGCRLSISIALLHISAGVTCAQTPWQAAPAKPAVLPPAAVAQQNATSSVASPAAEATSGATPAKPSGAQQSTSSTTPQTPLPRAAQAGFGNVPFPGSAAYNAQSLNSPPQPNAYRPMFPGGPRVGSLGAPPTAAGSSSISTPAHVPLRNGPATPPTSFGNTASNQFTDPSSLPVTDLPLPNLPLPNLPAFKPPSDVAANSTATQSPNRYVPGTLTDIDLPDSNYSSSPPGSPLVPPAGVAPAAERPTVALTNGISQNQQLPSGGQLVGFRSQADASAAAEELQAGELVAVVGDQHILFGDMAHFIDPIIQENRDKISKGEMELQVRTQFTRQVLPQYIEVKALYLEFFRDMTGTAPPKEINDMKKQVMTRAGRIFFEKQIPNLMKQYEVHDLQALEAALGEKSLALSTVRKQFIEQVLSQELVRKYIPEEFDVHRDELLDRYRAEPERWKVDARAKWRELSVRFDKHTKAEADQLIKQMGNQVLYGGKPFWAVAKDASEGFTATDGGLFDWTTKGSLKSQKIDEAIFTLPINKMSQVIEDDIGYHIIEVLEREDSHTVDFVEAQAKLRDEISAEKRKTATDEFKLKVLARTPIWSRWPEDLKDISHARPLSEAIGN